jgi:hypothetical protein
VSDAINIASKMMRYWPNPQWEDEHLDQWISDLSKRDPERAAEAVEHLRETCKFRPAWTEFVAAYQMVCRKAIEPVRAQDRGPLPAKSPMFAAVRAALAAASQNHDHRHGAEACPVCSPHGDHGHDRMASQPKCPRCKELAGVFLAALP